MKLVKLKLRIHDINVLGENTVSRTHMWKNSGDIKSLYPNGILTYYDVYNTHQSICILFLAVLISKYFTNFCQIPPDGRNVYQQ